MEFAHAAPSVFLLNPSRPSLRPIPVNQPTLTDAALQSLLENRAKFVSFVQKHVNSPSDAEDIVQSAFVRSVEKADTIDDQESVVAWFYRVLRNSIIDHYRRRAARDRGTEEFAREMRDLEQRLAFDPSDRNEICQCVKPLLDALKPEYRDALTLVDLEEKPLRDLAAASGITDNNAAVRVHRARQALRKQVQLTCGACATHGCVDCRCHSKAAH
jgi:RNA polymerase sigma-70 factor, ECF subfamily